MTEPKWLEWAKRLQAIAQSGLNYVQDPYDKERFEMVREISAEIITNHTDHPKQELIDIMANETGYATPKVGTRAVILRENAGKTEVLLVEELKWGSKWTLPGGYADIHDTPSEAVQREVWEETGYEVKAKSLLGIFNRNQLPDVPPRLIDLYALVFLCEIVGGTPKTSIETGRSDFFPVDALPELALEQTHPLFIQLGVDYLRAGNRPTVFN